MSFKIIKAGILDTIQDTGRYGYRHLGINPSGAMDRFSARLCNVLLGKSMGSPVIEMHFPAGTFLFQKATVACLSGAAFSATINNRDVPLHQPFVAPANSQLQFEGSITGTRCYLSILHDLQLDEWLASASTNLKAVAGGWKGRKLLKDDCIPFKENVNLRVLTSKTNFTTLPWKASSPQFHKELDCIRGNEWHWLTPEAQSIFQNSPFSLSTQSDRMGYRLLGKELITVTNSSLVSSAVDFGTIQLLPNGQLIILMADHQTTGGYPRVANVSTTSLRSLAQARPGDEISFRFINLQEAEDNLIQQLEYLEQLQNTCKLKIEKFLHASM